VIGEPADGYDRRARYPVRDVLRGITAATALVHLASEGIGFVLSNILLGAQWVTSWVTGLAFCVRAVDLARSRN